MNLQEKEQIVAELNSRFASSAAVFLVDYQGCTCQSLTGLRRELRPGGSEFAVIKNTLAKLAAKDTAASELGEFFDGPTAIVWSSEDAVTPAKVLTKFAKSQEKFSVKAGLVDGQVIDPAGVQDLANMPSREQLFANLLALINAPATKLLQTINAPAQEVVRLLEAWRGELEKRQS